MILPGFLLVGLFLGAPAPGVDCQAFNDACREAQIEAAISMANLEQGASSQVAAGNALARLQINLQLMAANGCPLPKEPVRSTDYLAAAANCASARIEVEIARIQGKPTEESPAACDESTWQRQKPSAGEARDAAVLPELKPEGG